MRIHSCALYLTALASPVLADADVTGDTAAFTRLEAGILMDGGLGRRGLGAAGESGRTARSSGQG